MLASTRVQSSILPSTKSHVARFNYGGIPPARSPTAPPHPARRDRHLNFGGACVTFFLPIFVFVGTAWSFAFYVHYERTWSNFVIALLGFGAVLTTAAVAFKARFLAQDDLRQATWHQTLFWSMLLAWILSMAVGEFIYMDGMKTYYTISSLNHYAEISPDKYQGEQLLDAGIIHFADSAQLDRTRFASYTHHTSYCVAPIGVAKDSSANATGDAPLLASYDFWAVGTNCCGEPPTAAFECGDYSNPWARAGLRVLVEEPEKTLYMTAVKQAEAIHGIRAANPLFFEWILDPPAKVSALQDTGFHRFLLAVFLFVGLQLFAVVLRLAALLKNI